MNAIKNFLTQEKGAVAIEYSLLAALIAVAIVTGASLLGKNICSMFNAIDTELTDPLTASFVPAAC